MDISSCFALIDLVLLCVCGVLGVLFVHRKLARRNCARWAMVLGCTIAGLFLGGVMSVASVFIVAATVEILKLPPPIHQVDLWIYEFAIAAPPILTVAGGLLGFFKKGKPST